MKKKSILKKIIVVLWIAVIGVLFLTLLFTTGPNADIAAKAGQSPFLNSVEETADLTGATTHDNCIEWMHWYNGWNQVPHSINKDFGRDVQFAPDRYLYFAGQTFTGTISDGGKDFNAWIRKVDPATGNEIWTREYNHGSSNNQDAAFGITVNNNRLWTTGFTTISYWDAAAQRMATERNTWVQKRDLNGQEKWSIWLGNAGEDQGHDIVADNFGNAFVAGERVVNGIKNIHVFRLGNSDTYPVKIPWSKTFGSGTAYDIKMTSNSLVTVGRKNSYIWVQSMRPSDGFVYWAKEFSDGVTPLSPYYREGKGVVIDGNGFIYVAGHVAATNIIAGSSVTHQNLWIHKLSSSGNPQPGWPKTYDVSGEFEDDLGNDITLDGSGNIFVAGKYGNVLYTLKLDPNGNELWRGFLSDGYLNSFDENNYAVAVDTLGGVYTAGANYWGESDSIDIWMNKYCPP